MTISHEVHAQIEMVLFWPPSNDFLTLIILLGGRLQETENKRICQISGLKSGCGRLRSLSSVHL